MAFTLLGAGFDTIPRNAIGVLSRDNNDPLLNRNTDKPYYMLHVAEKTDGRLTLVNDYSVTYANPEYLGAIISADREQVYWVNDSKPLP